MFGTPGPWQLLIVLVVVLLLFGNRLPSVMRSLGEGITEFKKGIKGGEKEAESTTIDSRKISRDQQRAPEEQEVREEEAVLDR